MCYARYNYRVKTVSHRELRNSSGAVLKSVAAGESYTVTNDGSPVARLVPIDAPVSELRCARRTKLRGGFATLARYSIAESSADTLDDLRADH